MHFLNPDNQLLSEKSTRIPLEDIHSSSIQQFIDEFIVFCGYETKVGSKPKLKRMVGCAAPQVGKMIRLILVDQSVCPKKRNYFQTDLQVLINPVIIWSSQAQCTYSESCYSIPICYSGIIQRPFAVVVEAYDRSGKKLRKRYEGYTARVVQHEIDHLDGICFPQRAQSPKEIHTHHFKRREDLLYYRDHFEDWDKHVTHHEFSFLKGGKDAKS